MDSGEAAGLPVWAGRHWPVIVLIALHVALAAFLALRYPLAPDETYYWEWSRNPALGYYDQGPGIAWWIRASCALFGDTVWGVRAGIVLAAAVTDAFLYATALTLFDRRVAVLALIVADVTPLAIAGSVVATYDPLQAMFWMIAVYALARAVVGGSRRAWIGFGLAVGMGFLCKNTMALLLPCALLAMVGRAEWRRWLRRPEPWIAAVIAVVTAIPNLWWQTQNGWVTYLHVLHLAGSGSSGSAAKMAGEFVGSQAGLLGPLLFFGMIAAMWPAARAAREADRAGEWLLFCVSAPVLAFFLLLSLKTKVQANWAATGWLGAAILYARWALQTRRRILYGVAALALTGFLSALLVSPDLRIALHIRLAPRLDQMNKMYGGAQLASVVAREMDAMRRETGCVVVAGAATYDTASQLAFYLPGQPRTRCFILTTRPNAYMLWPDRTGLTEGGCAVVVDDLAPDDPRLPPLRLIFDRVVPVLQPVPIYRRPLYKQPVRVYHLYLCYGYHANAPAEHHRPF